MKQIIFSFDDGRLDTYTIAYPIMKKYGLPFTLNVTTDFVLNPERYTNFGSANNKSMRSKQVLDCYQNGVEIACHGHTHKNTKDDVLKNISALEEMGIDANGIGFASPNSEVTKNNCADLQELLKEGKLSYIRSGRQVRREGFVYSVLTMLERLTHSKWLFYILNKRNIITDSKQDILMSVGITAKNTLNQILYLVDKVKDGQSLILMFHSVLSTEDIGYGKDLWYFDSMMFEKLVSTLVENKNVKICTTKDLIISSASKKGSINGNS